MNDTIFARATAAGRAAVAIMRISGPDAGRALERLTGELPAARQAAVRSLCGRDGELIDQALVLWMPGPASFTGEDCAELQVHGSPVVLEELATALRAHGLRPAEPGEFSRRAFATGKMDLLQAEAVADLVDAETAAQKRQALLQMAGGVGRRFEGWRDALIRALALIEAENDFPDEDLPGALAEQARPALQQVASDLSEALTKAARGQRVRDGYAIALIGRPNAGKSSLFNALLRRDAAIVSRRPGTTRDVVESDIQIAGYMVTLADTAGVRETPDEIETEGVRRARAWADAAAWRLAVIDPQDGPDLGEIASIVQPGDLAVLSKADLTVEDQEVSYAVDTLHLDVVEVSAATGAGLAELMGMIERKVTRELGAAEPPTATRARHQEAIEAAYQALVRAQAVLAGGPERAAEDVRAAIRALQAVIGGVDNEAVLDRVFSSFCIGK